MAGSGWRGLRLESEVTPEATAVLSVAEGETRAPGPDEVIVRIEAAPINPSDLIAMFAGGDVSRAEVGGSAERPAVSVPLSPGAFKAVGGRIGQRMALGNEGAGTVVATGGEGAARALEGRRVAVAGGAYSQLRRVKASACLPLPDGASATDGAACYVNPMTALSMVESMWAEGHRALVQTAAASSLGQMLIRVCAEDDIPLVNVVRSPAQVARLREVGAEYVCDTTAANFEVDLTAALKATGATIAFDAVGGGGLADRILACMERAISDGAPYQDYGSAVHKQVYLYGFLERSPAVLHRAYGASWSVGGWLMPRALQRAGSERVAALRARVAAGLTTTFATEFTDEVTLTGALQPEAIATYGRPTTGTKFLVRPSE